MGANGKEAKEKPAGFKYPTPKGPNQGGTKNMSIWLTYFLNCFYCELKDGRHVGYVAIGTPLGKAKGGSGLGEGGGGGGQQPQDSAGGGRKMKIG